MGDDVVTTVYNDDFHPSVGDTVYFYSNKVERVVEGIVEGYASHDWKKYKVLEDLQDGTKLRHIVWWSKLRPTRKDAEDDKVEESSEDKNLKAVQDAELFNGMVVYLKPEPDAPDVNRHNGKEIPYQIVAIYGRVGKVKLVTEYGEEIGTFPISQIVVTEREPLFNREQYQEDTMVTWVEGDDVYMGRIIKVHDWTVDVTDVCKLMPADFKKRLPFYKIPDGRDQKPQPKITVIIDDEKDGDLC